MTRSSWRLQLAALLLLVASAAPPTVSGGNAKKSKYGAVGRPRFEPPSSDLVLLDAGLPILLDYSKGVMAVRNRPSKKCTISNLARENVRDNIWDERRQVGVPRTFIVGKNVTKYEVTRIAGITIINFCRGLKIHLVLTSKEKDPELEWNTMLKLNAFPGEHAKDEDKTKKMTQDMLLMRRRRQVNLQERAPRKKYRGQTQTQFIAFNNNGNSSTGTAEAVAQPDLSRATVSE